MNLGIGRSFGPGNPPVLRLILIAVGVLAIAILIGVGVFPAALGTTPVRTWMLDKVDHALAPGSLEVEAFRFSWFGPTRLEGLTLRDHQGDPVVVAPSATWDRTLGHLLWDRPRLGTLLLHRAVLDVERDEDGSIDLYKTLQPILGLDPKIDLTIRADDAALRFYTPELRAPIDSGRAAFNIHFAPRPNRLTWKLALNHADSDIADAVQLDGWYAPESNDQDSAGDLQIELTSQNWPIDVQILNLDANTRLDAQLTFLRHLDAWRILGTTAFLNLNATGPALQGDTLQLDRVAAAYDLAFDPYLLAIEHLNIFSDPVTLTASGRFPLPGNKRSGLNTSTLKTDEPAITLLSARLDLPAWLDQLSHRERWTIRQGVAQLEVALDSESEETFGLNGTLAILDLAWVDRNGEVVSEPVGFDFQTRYQPADASIGLQQLIFTSQHGTLLASGRFEGLDKSPTAALNGQFTPDWDTINALVADWIEPGARVEGEAVHFQLGFPLKKSTFEDPISSIDAEARLLLLSADCYGLQLDPVELVAQLRDGTLEVPPIEARLNGGRLWLEPQIDWDDSGRLFVRFDERSHLQDAEVNEEVSRRVLAYVAPVLGQATNPRGWVSAELDVAAFPLDGDFGRDLLVEGQVVFDDVEFIAGPLPREILRLVRLEQRALKLDDPVTLTIVDGRVHSQGLAVPIGDLARFEIDGSVSFDAELDLIAQVPITAPILANNPFLRDIAAGNTIKIPIHGTLSEPRIEGESLGASMLDFGEEFLFRGAAGLLDRLTRPRPPGLTPRERREQRQRQREERRRNRP